MTLVDDDDVVVVVFSSQLTLENVSLNLVVVVVVSCSLDKTRAQKDGRD